MKGIYIVIPAYEPDSRLLQLLEALDRENLGPVCLVDDGSGPAYREIFHRALPLVQRQGGMLLAHDRNQGKGAALKTAFGALLPIPCLTGVVTADCDGQHDPDSIRRVAQALEKNPQALVLGVRQFRGEQVPWKSRVGNRLTAAAFRFLAGVPLEDTQTGLRGIPREFMARLVHQKENGFDFEMAMLAQAAEEGKICQLPIATLYDSRDHHQTHFHPWVDSAKIYRVLWRQFFRFCLSSLSGAAVDLAAFQLLCQVLRPRWPAYALAATAAARVLSGTWNWWVNYRFVFRSSAPPPVTGARYLLLALAQMTASGLLVAGLLWCFPGVPPLAFKGAVDTALFLVSYKVQRQRVFSRQ